MLSYASACLRETPKSPFCHCLAIVAYWLCVYGSMLLIGFLFFDCRSDCFAWMLPLSLVLAFSIVVWTGCIAMIFMQALKFFSSVSLRVEKEKEANTTAVAATTV